MSSNELLCSFALLLGLGHTNTCSGNFRCLLLLRMHETRKGQRWLSKDYKFGIFENGLVLPKKEFSKSLAEARVAGLFYQACESINCGLHSAEFGVYYGTLGVCMIIIDRHVRRMKTAFNPSRLGSTDCVG